MEFRSRTRALALTVAVVGCTVDSEDGATSLGGTAPGTSVTTTVGTTMTATSVSSTGTSVGTTDDDGSETGPQDSTSDTPPDDSSGGATGPNEQPDDGLYSACEDTTDCFGTVACVLVMGSLGYCSNNCTIPGDCGVSPGGTAQPACVTASVLGTDMQVCALDCAGGMTCPGGMECLPLGASMVCV